MFWPKRRTGRTSPVSTLSQRSTLHYTTDLAGGCQAAALRRCVAPVALGFRPQHEWSADAIELHSTLRSVF
jgi:hypothetical protein